MVCRLSLMIPVAAADKKPKAVMAFAELGAAPP
jgi:hypothetical protein